METRDVQRELLKKAGEEIQILEEGQNRFRIFTPFMFGDGDHIAVVLKQEGNNWILSDEGDTYAHLNILGVSDNLLYGTRRDLVAGILEEFHAEDRDGELIAKLEVDRSGSILYSFIQTIVKISDLVYLSRARVKTAFLEDFKDLIREAIPNASRYEFNWYNQGRDPQSKYKVDCRINNLERPLTVFALQNDEKIRDSTITIRQFEKWGVPFFPIGIFKNMEENNRRVVARFSDACEKVYSNIEEEQTRQEIIAYLRQKAEITGSN